jgi:hypothetical protein
VKDYLTEAVSMALFDLAIIGVAFIATEHLGGFVETFFWYLFVISTCVFMVLSAALFVLSAWADIADYRSRRRSRLDR